MEKKHTPLPYGIRKWPHLEIIQVNHVETTQDKANVICKMRNNQNDNGNDQRNATANFIVRACNSHYDLIETLEDIARTAQMAFGNGAEEFCQYAFDKAVYAIRKAKGE